MPTVYLLFENLFEAAGATISSSPAADAGWPVANITGWRTGTHSRARSSALTPWDLTVDLGVGQSAQPNAVAFAGHNMKTASPLLPCVAVAYSDDGAAFTDALAATTFSDDLPHAKTFTVGAAHRYWRVRFQGTSGGGLWATKPAVGIVVLGRRLDLGAIPASCDLFGYGQDVEPSPNERGAAIGANAGAKERMLQLDYADAGLPVATFFKPASGIGFDTHFVPHAIDGGRAFFCVAEL